MRSLVRAIPILLTAAPLAALLAPRGAETVPLYAARTGLLCKSCHFDPNGGGPRNEFGFGFAKNRHALEAESEGPWKDLTLTNRVGENMPVYFGVNQRFMLLTNATVKSDSLDRFGFFNMESAIHIAFQPHPRLTLVYTNDAFSSSAQASAARPGEAFGIVGGFPLEGYVRAGRFRVPFGLRMDDHTVATRAGFLDFATQRSFLPYDPRLPDMGVEVGAERSGVFGRASYTNGRANALFFGQYAETKAVKLGYHASVAEAAISLYDDYAKKSGFGQPQRQTRWGAYGMTHWRQLALLGEAAAGTDEDEPLPGPLTGIKTNVLAGWGEIDYAATRALNLRTRYDYLVTDRSSDPVVRDDNTFSRWALEGEWVPVPFAELRASLRHIDYKNNQGPLAVDNENQAYLQFHFSY
ncbi:MAG TPA: hypothetical protein VGK89_07395 [Candidatus Eisenbacteria bacterium]|jgi:hypothetical protein